MADSPVTLITGGSSGIGAAAALMLLDLGHRVAITGRDPVRLAEVSGQLAEPDRLLTVAADVSDYDAVRSAVDATVAAFGQLDAAVANAGFATVGNLAEGDPAHWREMVLTNVLGPALLIKAALPALRETGGRIVLIGSTAGTVHLPGNFYGVTKWAVTALAGNARLMATGDGVTLINRAEWRHRSGTRTAASPRARCSPPDRSPSPSYGLSTSPRASTSTQSPSGPSARQLESSRRTAPGSGPLVQ
jgi:NADP-dependent 3-hydroxy acid dehydrogenase YdfG